MGDIDSAGESRRSGWTPRPRAEWVQRLNDKGRHLDISGIVPLDSASLRETAMRNTGLADFGADDWREPFEMFVQSLEKDAALNLTGRIMTRSELLPIRGWPSGPGRHANPSRATRPSSTSPTNSSP